MVILKWQDRNESLVRWKEQGLFSFSNVTCHGAQALTSKSMAHISTSSPSKSNLGDRTNVSRIVFGSGLHHVINVIMAMLKLQSLGWINYYYKDCLFTVRKIMSMTFCKNVKDQSSDILSLFTFSHVVLISYDLFLSQYKENLGRIVLLSHFHTITMQNIKEHKSTTKV